jgi:hypothetical protein
LKQLRKRAERQPASRHGWSAAVGVIWLVVAWLVLLGVFWQLQGRLAP